MRPTSGQGPHVPPGGCLRGAPPAGRREAPAPGGEPQAVAVLLGHGRRGGLDQGEGAAHVLTRPGPRPHLCAPAA